MRTLHEVIAPFVKDKGYDWESSIDETPVDLWSLQEELPTQLGGGSVSIQEERPPRWRPPSWRHETCGTMLVSTPSDRQRRNSDQLNPKLPRRIAIVCLPVADWLHQIAPSISLSHAWPPIRRSLGTCPASDFTIKRYLQNHRQRM